jgi:hypothetical protein
MFGDAYPYKEGEITILQETDVLRWCREQVKGKEPLVARDLFLYRQNEFGNYVIAQWIGGNVKDLYIDIINLGPEGLGGFDKEKSNEFLRRVLDPLTADEILEMTTREEYNWLTMQQEDHEAEKERLAKVAIGE